MILIVDDMEAAQETLRLLFEKVGHQTVIVAGDGRQAVEIATAQPDVNLVLLDYQMPIDRRTPGKGGIWAAEQLRVRRPEVEVVFVSAYTGPDVVAEARASGAAAFIAKDRLTEPGIVAALCQADVQALRAAAQGVPNVWVFEGNRDSRHLISHGRREMERIGEVVNHLAPRDMKLMCQIRETLRETGLRSGDFLETVALVRQEYIRRHGLKRYLSDMLGRHAAAPATSCVVYGVDGRVVRPSKDQTVLRFLLSSFTPETLPYRLEIQGEGNGKAMVLAI